MYARQRKTRTPKRLLRDLLDLKQTPRPLFIPLVYRYASKISQIPLDDMLNNPNHLSRSLIMAQELFGYDGIVSSYDLQLEMEALGFDDAPERLASQEAREAMRDRVAAGKLGKILSNPTPSLLERGRIPVVRESTAQICAMVGREIPVIGILSSPITLLNRILCSDFGLLWHECREQLVEPLKHLQSLALAIVKAYCELRVDAIWVAEEDWSGFGAEEVEYLRPSYRTFWNVTQYYEVKAIHSFHRYDTSQAESYLTLGADGIFFGGPQATELPLSVLMEWVERYPICVGLPCPYPENPEQIGHLENLVSSASELGRGFFLSTPCEVPLDIPVDWIHHVANVIKGQR